MGAEVRTARAWAAGAGCITQSLWPAPRHLKRRLAVGDARGAVARGPARRPPLSGALHDRRAQASRQAHARPRSWLVRVDVGQLDRSRHGAGRRARRPRPPDLSAARRGLLTRRLDLLPGQPDERWEAL